LKKGKLKMKEAQVLLLKNQLTTQLEILDKLGMNEDSKKAIKRAIIKVDKIIDSGDYRSTKSKTVILGIKSLFVIYKLKHQIELGVIRLKNKDKNSAK
jgi:hypothetical protein